MSEATSPHGEALSARAMAGDRRAIARLLTLLDDGGARAASAARTLAEHAGRAQVLGITGVPGSGKSTLVNALLGVWLARGLKVAVVAVDPSSPVSGGAVLGDRVRMGEHGAHPNVFIRSLSARGELGGLSRAARAAVDCFDAAGFDRIIVETVGAGQSETAIAALADTRIVLCPPGLGDEVQAIKAGILEIADLLVVSKGDLPLAQETVREMREMLTLRRRVPEGTWQTRVLSVSAKDAQGIDELIDAVQAHAEAQGPGRRLGPRAAAGAAADPVTTRLRALVERDGICSTLGIRFVDGGLGHASVELTVDARHLNFNGGCHGGAVFSLADAALGLACNSHGPVASGIDCHMTFQTGVREGDRLLARAVELRRARHIGFYRVDVVRLDGGGEMPVSQFTGTVHVR